MSVLDELYEAIEKAQGLIRAGGRPSFLKRVGFLARSANSNRIYDIGRYMTSRKTGGRVAGTGKRRKGSYSGAYSGIYSK